MFYLLTTLIVIAAVLLILVVLIQNSKKEGLGSTWGAASASQLMGVQKTGDFLEQFTWGLVLTIFFLTLATSRFLHEVGGRRTLTTSPNIERAKAQMPAPSVEQPVEEVSTTTPEETAPAPEASEQK